MLGRGFCDMIYVWLLFDDSARDKEWVAPGDTKIPLPINIFQISGLI